MDDNSEIKQEPVDSNTDSDAYEGSEQFEQVLIKEEVYKVDNDMDYSEETTNSAHDAETSKEISTRSESRKISKTNKRSLNKLFIPEPKNDSKLSKDKLQTLEYSMSSNLAKPYNCQICDKSFGTKYYFNLHVQAHSGHNTQHKCTHCDKKCVTASNLKSHLLTHTVEKPHKCAICSKEFKRFGELKIHLLIHSEKKQHKCVRCFKEFRRLFRLKRHILAHTDKTQHKCELCCKEFRQLGHLKTHLLIHSDKKPHKCIHCSKEFRQPGHLKAHLLIHSDKKPHACELCNKEFRQLGHLKTHLLIHSDQKTHK